MGYPILMADIIKSSRKEPEKVMQQFKELVLTINKIKCDNLISPLTITLGDEFQGITDTMENGIKTIFALEELIIAKKYDLKLRYVLLLGKIETQINTKIAHEMLGEGLTRARRNLNLIKNKDSRFNIYLNESDNMTESYLNNAFFIYQKFIDSWKEKDFEIVKEFLQSENYKTVAQNVNINPSNAWRRKKSLNIKEYNEIKKIIIFYSKF
jgi:hypothetical protein